MATLSQYVSRTYLELQTTQAAGEKLFSEANLITFINLARSQLAGEGHCIRYFAELTAPQSTRALDFDDIDTGVSATNGIAGIFHVRQAFVQLGDGLIYMTVRPFPWFSTYHMNQVVPIEAIPTDWSQYGQGVTGSIYLDPVPDQEYTLSLDCVCYPIDLEDDSTPEAIPYPWTDVVPFYAAWYALTSAQRMTDAEIMMQRVQLYMGKARNLSNSSVVPQAFEDAPQDPSLTNRYGLGGVGGQR